MKKGLAAIKRAKQLTGFKWTPLRDISTRLAGKLPTLPSEAFGAFEEGKEYQGIMYSNCTSDDKFFGDNVSIETYLSALANPDSVLYTNYSKDDPYYGIVCTSFVRYALGIRKMYSNTAWHTIPGMKVVQERGKLSVDGMEVCDILQASRALGDGPNHVALITDILRDETGKITEIEISEAIHPLTVTRKLSVENLYTEYAKYKLYRYEYLDDIPPFDEEQNKILYESGIDKKLPMIAVNYGNKSNYLEGEGVGISVFAEGKNVIEIYKDGELVSELKVNGRARITRRLAKGYYVVKLKDTDEYTEFCVCNPEISYTVEGDMLTVTVAKEERSKLLHMDYRNAVSWEMIGMAEELTEEEKESGVFTRKIPDGVDAFKIFFENEYGIWTHPRIEIVK